MSIREDRIERGDGSVGLYGVVEKSDLALIIPIEAGDVYLVEQYRYPVAGRFLEFPQGSWDHDAMADPSAVARGELLEETGFGAHRIESIGHLFVACGMSNQGFYVFQATELEEGLSHLENEEQDLVVKRDTDN